MNLHIHWAGEDDGRPTYRLSVRDGETILATAPQTDYAGMALAESNLDEQLAPTGLALASIPLAGHSCPECRHSGFIFAR